MKLTQEEKNKLKIIWISEHEINFEIGRKTFQIYNYKDGDFSIRMEEDRDSIEILFNEMQIDSIKKFLNNEFTQSSE
jgi:hypothetical protein